MPASEKPLSVLYAAADPLGWDATGRAHVYPADEPESRLFESLTEEGRRKKRLEWAAEYRAYERDGGRSEWQVHARRRRPLGGQEPLARPAETVEQAAKTADHLARLGRWAGLTPDQWEVLSRDLDLYDGLEVDPELQDPTGPRVLADDNRRQIRRRGRARLRAVFAAVPKEDVRLALTDLHPYRPPVAA